MGKYYRIKDWNTIFENAESRKYKKLNWVPMPNKWDGLGFSRLRKHKNFISAFSGWSLIVQIASKMPQRGVLVTADGWELSPEDMADLTGCPVEVFRRAIEVLSDPKIGWIEEVSEEGVAVRQEPPEKLPDCPESSGNLPESPEIPGKSPGSFGNITVEQNRTEQKEKKKPPIIPQGGGLDLFDSLKKDISKIYNRKESTAWSDKEVKKLREIARRGDALEEFKAIEALYESGKYEYFRRDIITLLNNWTGEVDRARLKGYGEDDKQQLETDK
jgi:hypothetical protein